MLDHNYSDKFSKQFNFWKGTWQGSWLYFQDVGNTVLISVTEHRVFSVLDGKVLVETAEETGEVDNPHIICGLSLRYLNSRSGKWVMIQAWFSSDMCIMMFTFV